MYPVIFCLLVIIPVSASESPFACESTTVRAGNGQPYYQRINAEKTYDEAEDECRMKGAELYTTRNDAVKTETSDNASTLRTWISAKRRYWIHDSLHLGLSYESWARGHPISVENNCVYAMNKNTSMALYSGPCSMENNVICMDQELGFCDGEHVYDYMCYFIPEEGNFPKTFTESLRICERHNGHLVAIFDKKQMKWISNTFTSSFWTGYKYNDNNTSLFWYDGHRVMNTNWKEGQPASGDCLVIDAEGKWQTEDCLNRHTFICILEVPYASKTTTCKRYDDECVCYWTEDKYVSFTEAMESCMSDGGTLGYPNSEEKLSFLSNLVHNENFWVGISDNHTKGVYRGSDASAITWIKWYHSYGPRYPYDCIYAKTNYFQTRRCYSTLKFVCQSLPDSFFQGCSKNSGCLRAQDYWNVENSDEAYTGFKELTIKNVKNIEICWDMCVNYIGFVCLVVTYNIQSKECSMSSEISDTWRNDPEMISRKRTKRVLDAASYCLDDLPIRVPLDEAIERCTNYKTGWKIPVILDQRLLEMIQQYGWLSAVDTDSLPSVFKTLDDVYLTYSRWGSFQPTSSTNKCVYALNKKMYVTACSSNRKVSCFSLTDDICQKSPNITNGIKTVNMSSKDILYTCEDGYFMPTLNVSTVKIKCDCPGSEILLNIENCTVIQCPMTRDNSNGTVVSMTGLGVNDTVIYKCPIGFRVIDIGSIYYNLTCIHVPNTTIGVWSDYPQFEVMKCNDSPNVNNANFSTDNKIFGSIMEIICIDWYWIPELASNTVNTTCVMDQSGLFATWCWTPPCQEIICPEPPTIPMGTYVIQENKAIYMCETNYKIKGKSSNTTEISCIYDENFRASWLAAPICQAISCPGVTDVQGANVLSKAENNYTGAVIQYQCHDGLVVYEDGLQINYTNQFNKTCIPDSSAFTGRWIGNYSCDSVTCSEPPLVLNSQVTARGYNIGDTALYTCDSQYTVISDSDLSNVNETWESTCVLDDNDKTKAVWNPILECIDLKPTTTSEMPDLIDDVPLIRQCPPINIGTKSLTHSGDLFINSPVSYVASVGYVFDNGGKTRSSLCLSGGHWSAAVPHLRRNRCPLLPPILEATKSTHENYVGIKVTIRCNDVKAKLENGLSEVTIKCINNEQWTFIPRSCETQRCAPFEYVEHSHLKSFNNTIGGLAILECNLSYRFADGTKTKTFRCLSNLSWESSERCYLDVCPPLRTPINGEMSTDIALEGTIVEVKCLRGFMFPDRSRLKFIICTYHFVWNESITNCIDIRCPDLPELTNGNRSSSETLYNSNITYWCDGKNRLQYGYRRMTIRCEENGEWTHSNLSCDSDRCPPIPRVVNAIPSTSLAVNGTTVIYSCVRGYLFTNNETQLFVGCNGVAWNMTETACLKVNCPPLSLSHATVFGNGSSFGEVVNFTCDEGHIYGNKNSGTLECKANSRWNGDTEGCTAIDCGSPPDVTYSFRSVPPSHKYGTTVTYTCLSSYWFTKEITSRSITCTRHGKWSDILDYCTIITCPPVPVWDDMETNTTDNVVDTKINVSCIRDELNHFAISTCTERGEWEPALNNCRTERIGVFEPEVEEARGASSIAIVVGGLMAFICVLIILSDAPVIMKTLKGEIPQQKRKAKFIHNRQTTFF